MKLTDKEIAKKNEITKRMAEIEKEYGMHSNIPISSDYWSLRNELGVLRTKENS